MEKSRKSGRSSQAPARLAGPIRPDLGLWVEGLAARRRTDRWSRWAESLASRHGAISRAGAPAPMTFAASGVVARILRERWISSINLYPTVRLSVRQILGQIPHFSGPTLNRLRNEILQADQPPRMSVIGAGQQTIYRRRPISARFAEGIREPRHVARPGGSPLDRVFLRLNGADDLLHSRGRIALAQETVYATTRRIIENAQRTEGRTARPAGGPSFVFKRTAPSSMAVDRSELSDEPGFAGQRAGHLSRGLPAVDVNQLTDQVIRQIDQRATAWRERMGKI